jgi:hypothetical protein
MAAHAVLAKVVGGFLGGANRRGKEDKKEKSECLRSTDALSTWCHTITI